MSGRSLQRSLLAVMAAALVALAVAGIGRRGATPPPRERADVGSLPKQPAALTQRVSDHLEAMWRTDPGAAAAYSDSLSALQSESGPASQALVERYHAT